MSKAVAKKEQSNVAVLNTPPQNSEQIDSSDLVLASVYLMQSNSEWVKTKKADTGDFVKSQGTKKVGSAEEPLMLVPLTFNKNFRIVAKKGNKWVRNEPFDPSVADVWEFKEDGVDLKRLASINLYAYVYSDLVEQIAAQKKAAEEGELMDPASVAMPVMISFRSTGYRAGKEVVTHFGLAKKCKSEPYMGVLKVSNVSQTGDDGEYRVMTVEPARGIKIPKESVADCAEWRAMMLNNLSSIRVDEAEAPEAESAPQTQF